MGPRAERFAQLIAEDLNQILSRGDIKDPRVSDAGFITITHVGVTDDLGLARVKVVLHGADETKSRDLVVKTGSQVIEVDKKSFQDAMKPVYDKFITDPKLKDMLARVQATK